MEETWRSSVCFEGDLPEGTEIECILRHEGTTDFINPYQYTCPVTGKIKFRDPPPSEEELQEMHEKIEGTDGEGI